MNSQLEEMRDELTRLTAEMDQVQSRIDHARLIFGNDKICAKQLDVHQAHVEKIRREIALGHARIKELS
jgi:hypothetical protein